jgi:hypothetical protein
MMLQIRNPRTSVGGKEILRSPDLDLRAGKVLGPPAHEAARAIASA